MKHNPFEFVFMTCKDLFYDAKRGVYVCASSGKETTTAGHCKRCPNLKVHRSENPIVCLDVE